MTRKLALFALIPAAAATLWFAARGEEARVTNYPPQGKGIVAFGDSLVEGVGAPDGEDFVSALSAKLGAPIANLGRSGDTTEDGLKRIDEAAGRKPGVVILLLGGNDFLRKVPKERTFANLAAIIDRLHASGAVVVLLGVRGGIFKDEYESRFEALAERYGTAYVPDVLDGIITDRSLMSDAIHPNAEGYRRIAEKVLPALERVAR